MASIIKQAIVDILNNAKEMDLSGSIFAHCSVFNGQFDWIDEGGGYSFPFPCFFVEVLDQEDNELSLGVTQTDLIFRLHIGAQEMDAMDGTMDQNLNVFDIRDSVKVGFMGFKPQNCTPLFSVAEMRDYDHKNVYHYMIDFKTGFIDTKGSPLDADSTKWQDFEVGDIEVELLANDEDGIFTDEFTDEFI